MTLIDVYIYMSVYSDVDNSLNCEFRTAVAENYQLFLLSMLFLLLFWLLLYKYLHY